MFNAETVRLDRAPPDGDARAKPRIGELDAVRGMALCGILFVNIPPLMRMDLGKLPIPHFLDLFVHQRFFPIFALLFGVGFGLFLTSAANRSARPRLLLARRLLALLVLGLLHQTLHGGEALTPYAAVGLVFLLPLSWANRWVNLVVGVGLIGGTLAYFGGGVVNVPGLLVFGFALAQFGVPRMLPRLGWAISAVFAVSLAGAVLALIIQDQDPLRAGFTTSSGVAGFCLAVAYITGLLLLLRTPLRRVLGGVLEPIGRMALTNYVTATLLVIPLGQLIGLYRSDAYGVMLLLALGTLVVQVLWSRLWLAHFQQGPLEWAWRCVTWWRIVPLRRAA